MRSRGPRWLALALPLALVVASCGDDDDDEVTDATSGISEVAETTAATDAGSATSAATVTTEGSTETTEGTEPAADGDFEGLVYDESALCGTEEYAGNLAKLEAIDELTVKFTMCNPDVALPSKVAFSSLQIQPQEYIDSTGGTGAFVEEPIGTGPYKLEAWERGSQIVLTRNDDYWGDPAMAETAVFRWSTEAAQRLVELQSGSVDGIDNVGTDDFATVEGDSNLQLVERDPLNVFYLGFNVDKPPFDNEQLRQAIGYAIDKARIVDNFYPAGSLPATQFLPPGHPAVPGGRDDVHGRRADGPRPARTGRVTPTASTSRCRTATSSAATCRSRPSWPRTSRPSWPTTAST